MYCEYRNRKKPKRVLLFLNIGLILAFLLSGCGFTKTAKDNDGSQVPAVPVTESQPSGGEQEKNDAEPPAGEPKDAEAEPADAAEGSDKADGKDGVKTPDEPEEKKTGVPEERKDDAGSTAAEPEGSAAELADTTEEPAEPKEEQTGEKAGSEEDTGNDDEDIPEIYEEAPEFSEFSWISSFFIDYDFDVVHDEKQETYTIRGTYDIDGNGENDEIDIFLKCRYEDGSFVEVNGSRSEFGYCFLSGEVYLMDLDKRDSYIEVAVEDEGPSADYSLMLFRYDGKEVQYLGSIDLFSYLDGKGKVVSWFHTSKGISPIFYSTWEEYADGRWVVKRNRDIKQYIGKTYEVSGSAYFVPLDKMPMDMDEYVDHIDWDTAVTEFDHTEIKMLNIYLDSFHLLNWFYVELPDGRRGLLYFWIGD